MKKRTLLLLLVVVAILVAGLFAAGRHVASSNGYRVADDPDWGWWDMR